MNREKRREYQRNRQKTISVSFSREYDEDLIAVWEAIPDKSYWMRCCLVRYQIENAKELGITGAELWALKVRYNRMKLTHSNY